jgi:hypothetical protein
MPEMGSVLGPWLEVAFLSVLFVSSGVGIVDFSWFGAIS